MKLSKNKVAVITVNYNNPLDTLKCLKSFSGIRKQGIDLKFYVVNNGCSDGSEKYLLKKYPDAIYINSPRNLGFAGGNNLGISKAIKDGAQYIFLINNDATIKDDHTLLDLISAQKDIAAPVLRYRRQNLTLYDHGGLVDRVWGRNHHLTGTDKGLTSDKKPEYFSGACLLIKTKVFKKVSLDDRYFLYYEDTDFCLNAQKQGFKMGLVPHVYVDHELSKSTSKLGKNKTKILAQSHLRFCTRHLPILSTPFYLAFNLYLRLKILFL